MSQPDITHLPSGEAVAFVGIALQAAAIVWIWRDWKMSQYQHGDWKKAHRHSESETISTLSALWAKFGGPASAPPIDWDNVGSAEIEEIGKAFPAYGDDDALKRRKIEFLTPYYGVGPSDAELVKIHDQLEYLALLRRGVADYRTFIRRKTFRTALKLMLVGFALQLVGSWPSRWFVPVETPPSATERAK